MDRLFVFIAMVVICVIGISKILARVRSIAKMRVAAQEYFDRLKRYIESGGRDTGGYSWLTQKSSAMQRQLGNSGILAAYRPPFANFQYTNYPILLNMLPELRKAMEESFALGRLANEYGMTLQEVMIRHLGEIDDAETEQRDQLKNPFIWLREGVRAILAFPFLLLQWLGILTESFTDRLLGNVLFKLVSSFVVLVGFIGSVVSIVVGWEQFTGMVDKFVVAKFLKNSSSNASPAAIKQNATAPTSAKTGPK